MEANRRTADQVHAAVSCITYLLILVTLVAFAPISSGQEIRYIYDDLNRLVGVVDSTGETVQYSYDSVGNILSISRYSSSQVSIIGFSPGSGAVGATVTVSGTGFSPTPGQNTVTFNGVTATVASATSTQLVTAVPVGAATGPIGVTAPAGSATSSAAFTVTAATGSPTITGFTPTIGTAGTPVTITGTNYDTTLANDRVKLNLSFAQVTSAAPTTLLAPVPGSTGSGRLSVSTLQGTAVSTEDFFIPPAVCRGAYPPPRHRSLDMPAKRPELAASAVPLTRIAVERDLEGLIEATCGRPSGRRSDESW